METLKFLTPKARKDHICDFCNGTIPKGDRYEKQINKYNGELYVWKSHKRCSDIVSKLDMLGHCDEGVTNDDFTETIIEVFDNIMPDLEETPDFQGKLDVVCEHYLTP